MLQAAGMWVHQAVRVCQLCGSVIGCGSDALLETAAVRMVVLLTDGNQWKVPGNHAGSCSSSSNNSNTMVLVRASACGRQKLPLAVHVVWHAAGTVKQAIVSCCLYSASSAMQGQHVTIH